jgi:hypothetical protein
MTAPRIPFGEAGTLNRPQPSDGLTKSNSLALDGYECLKHAFENRHHWSIANHSEGLTD